MTFYKLYIFDLDGTLVEPFTDTLLPDVKDKIVDLDDGETLFAIASNQGGVGLRHWMEVGDFGEPDKYPTADDCRERTQSVIDQLGIQARVYHAFLYHSKKGKWSPVPSGEGDKPEWKEYSRKPSPDMIIDAVMHAGIPFDQALMVGDWREDQEAAQKAGVRFQWAADFFGWEE